MCTIDKKDGSASMEIGTGRLAKAPLSPGVVSLKTTQLCARRTRSLCLKLLCASGALLGDSKEQVHETKITTHVRSNEIACAQTLIMLVRRADSADMLGVLYRDWCLLHGYPGALRRRSTFNSPRQKIVSKVHMQADRLIDVFCMGHQLLVLEGTPVPHKQCQQYHAPSMVLPLWQ